MTIPVSNLRRRSLLKLLGGTISIFPFGGASIARVAANRTAAASVGNEHLTVEFDSQMRTRIVRNGAPLTAFSASEALLIGQDGAIDRFLMLGTQAEVIGGVHGKGLRHVLRGNSDRGVEKTIRVSMFDRYPGFAIIQASYQNVGKSALPVSGWRNGAHEMLTAAGGFWSFSGASHADRRDWVQPVKIGFDQRNYMGMNASDYGGGTPVSDIWRRDAGLAVGHVETTPKLVAIPVRRTASGASVAVESSEATTLQPGERLTTHETFVAVHNGDYFAALDMYRRVMADRGLAAPTPPASAYQPIWCAWGYERNFTTKQIVETLPKAKSVGLDWAVLDDGWQTSEGDWKLDRTKFPRGEEDMANFAATIKDAGMLPRLWLAPLAVDQNTDLLRDHADMLLLGKDGKPQEVTWWDAQTLCPAYAPTIEYSKKLIQKIIGDWGYAGLKLDGQHLNGVAPCFNPAHNHKRPEESVEALQEYWKMVFDTALAINPQAVVELCPCGTSFAFHNSPYTNQVPSSDPLSSWQVRLKGKTLKALMGPSAAFAGDHVELSTGGKDFASTIGIGAVVSTKFTWPADTDKPIEKLPPGGYLLTAEKEVLWRKWIALYRDKMLPKGNYLGGLYDIGFDKPETHVVEKNGSLHFAFYADDWNGPIELRGLGNGKYILTDMFTGKAMGSASAAAPRLSASFSKFLLVQATPEASVPV
jgi:alpha-galactosidase